MFNSSVFFTSILLDLTCSTVPFCGVLNFSLTFDPLKLCKEELPKFVCDSSLDSNKYSIRLPLMSEFEIRDLFLLFKYVKTNHYAHFDIHDFVSFSTTKPFHPPFSNCHSKLIQQHTK